MILFLIPMKENKDKVSIEDRRRFMQMAVDLSEQALDAGKGGPFGAIVVRGTRIVGSSGNCVFKHTDPTAHAEIMAIRTPKTTRPKKNQKPQNCQSQRSRHIPEG